MILINRLVWAAVVVAVCFPVSAIAGDAGSTSAPLEMVLSLDPRPDAPRNSEGDIIRLDNGKLALVYTKFYGGDDDHSAARLAMRTSADGGRTWSEDSVLVDNEGGRNVMSVSLRSSADGGILLFYLRKDSAGTSCTMYVRRATALLENLSEPVMVTTLPGYHVVNNDRVLRLKSGRLLVPSALHTDPAASEEHPEGKFVENAAMICYYSDDDGLTWHKDRMPVTPMEERRIVLQEPGLVELTDGRIMMYIRTDQGYQYQSFSGDGGETWTVPEQMALASPRSPASIERLPDDGALVAVWNDHSGRWPFVQGKRTPLCIAVSRDEGKTWSPSQVLEDDPGGWFCYTSITFDGDSMLLGYCAGQEYEGGLNRLKVSRLPVSWVREIR